MDCANDTAMGSMGVFFGCIRGKSAVTGRTMVHRGMVYMIEGDIILLLTNSSEDLGVISKTFPKIAEFKVEELQGDRQDRFKVDSNFNLRYIATG